MKRTLPLLLVLVSIYSCKNVPEDIKPNSVVPSDKQIEYQKMEYIGFIHYNLFTFPAWPKEWDVDFNLHAPGNTIVECVFKKREITRLNVSPESRSKYVIVFNNSTIKNN
jgi:hypothetical protein